MYQIHFNEPVHVHFIGIGGISMSALAELLYQNHFTISGSDLKHSKVTEHLEEIGIHVDYGHNRKYFLCYLYFCCTRNKPRIVCR